MAALAGNMVHVGSSTTGFNTLTLNVTGTLHVWSPLWGCHHSTNCSTFCTIHCELITLSELHLPDLRVWFIPFLPHRLLHLSLFSFVSYRSLASYFSLLQLCLNMGSHETVFNFHGSVFNFPNQLEHLPNVSLRAPTHPNTKYMAFEMATFHGCLSSQANVIPKDGG